MVTGAAGTVLDTEDQQGSAEQSGAEAKDIIAIALVSDGVI